MPQHKNVPSADCHCRHTEASAEASKCRNVETPSRPTRPSIINVLAKITPMHACILKQSVLLHYTGVCVCVCVCACVWIAEVPPLRRRTTAAATAAHWQLQRHRCWGNTMHKQRLVVRYNGFGPEGHGLNTMLGTQRNLLLRNVSEFNACVWVMSATTVTWQQTNWACKPWAGRKRQAGG